MFLMTNLRMALSFGTHCKGQIYLIQEKLNILSGFTAHLQDNLCMKTLEQLVQRTYLTWPLPCLFRPWLRRFDVIFELQESSENLLLILVLSSKFFLINLNFLFPTTTLERSTCHFDFSSVLNDTWESKVDNGSKP